MGIIETDVTNDSLTIYRYFHLTAFTNLIKTKHIQLFTCNKYNDTDFFEGRITDNYKRVLERAFRLHYDDDGIMTFEDHLNNLFAQLEALRQNAYVSCWTTSKLENKGMWQSFANPGVIIKTTAGLFRDNLLEVSKQNEWMPGITNMPCYHGSIEYNREKMHFKLTSSNYNNFEFPIFHLSGMEEENYEHEQEYRFALIDYEGIADDVQEVLTSGSITEIKKSIDVSFPEDIIHEVIAPKHLEKTILDILKRKPKLRSRLSISCLF